MFLIHYYFLPHVPGRLRESPRKEPKLRSDRVAQRGDVKVGVERGVDLGAAVHDTGLKNIGNSIIWIFDQWDAGKTYWGSEVQLGLAEGGVGIVTDKNYDKYASSETKAAVEAAQKGITDGSIKVDTAFDANFDLAALRESVRP